MQSDDQILDLPEPKRSRTPRNYSIILLLGIVAFALGLTLEWWISYQVGAIFKLISACLIFLHFSLKIVVNWGIDSGQTLRDIGQFIALIGIYARFYLLSWSVYVMILGLTVYMFGFVVGRRNRDKGN